MQKLIILLLIASSLLRTDTLANFDKDAKTKNILILFSLAPTTPAYRTILDGIRQKLIEGYGNGYRLQQEFLETDKYPDSTYQMKQFNLINEKYRALDIDLLICVGINIIPTIKKYASDYLLNLPTISLDYDFSNYGHPTEIYLNNKTVPIGLKLNAEKSIATALNLFPATEFVYFICGSSGYDSLLMDVSKQAAAKIIKNAKVIFIDDIEMDELLSEVRKFPKNSIIFVPNFIRDKKMIPYFNPEAIRLIRREANLPVFNYNDTGFGEGSVGGYLISFEKVGDLTGEAAIELLNGTNPDSIQIDSSMYYSYMFDWRELKKWNIENSKLISEQSVIRFKESDFLDENKWMIGVALLFIVLQSLLIAALIRLNKNQKLMTKKIIDTENKYRGFINEDRILRLAQLTASLSHELNQPLTAILSNAQAGINFINSKEATDELLLQILQRIVENDKRGASVLSSIRGMLKLESREREKTNLNLLIEEVVSVFQSEARKYSTKISVTSPDQPVFIMADKIQIQQVLLNLISNGSHSMQNTQSNNKRLYITQNISADDVVISVRDKGKGIDESIKEKVFKPFVTSKTDGMGIGLAICRSIIEDHGGKIWAENLPDGGAKFSFSLKVYKDE